MNERSSRCSTWHCPNPWSASLRFILGTLYLNVGLTFWRNKSLAIKKNPYSGGCRHPAPFPRFRRVPWYAALVTLFERQVIDHELNIKKSKFPMHVWAWSILPADRFRSELTLHSYKFYRWPRAMPWFWPTDSFGNLGLGSWLPFTRRVIPMCWPAAMSSSYSSFFCNPGLGTYFIPMHLKITSVVARSVQKSLLNHGLDRIY
jgi:hypothetical protein